MFSNLSMDYLFVVIKQTIVQPFNNKDLTIMPESLVRDNF